MLPFFLRRKLVVIPVALLSLWLAFRALTDLRVVDVDVGDDGFRSVIEPLATSESDPFTHVLNANPPPGYVAFSRLYVFEGTIYAVVRDEAGKEGFPPLKYILSRAVGMGVLPDDPTDSEMRIVTNEEATSIFGPLSEAIPIRGASFILHDSPQFLDHYYHWWGEIILGAIRSYASLAFEPNMESPLMEPSRFILPNVHDDSSWRDHAGVIGPLMRAAFPEASIVKADYWEDLAALHRAFVFERALVVDRIAAHKSPLASIWFKMISSTMNLAVPARFWSPLRERIIRNVVGSSKPSLSSSSSPQNKTPLPLVLYISRQSTGRRLLDSAHADLVRALKRLEREEEEGPLCEVMTLTMESLTINEQIGLVGRAVIMIAVHGNGLTHQLWMPPSFRSTVIEITYPRSYVHDYAILSRNMGHKHYAIWNDTAVTFPDGKWYEGVNMGNPEDFHGSYIPVDGETVANIVRERLRERPS